MKKLSILTLSVSAILLLANTSQTASNEALSRTMKYSDTVLKVAGDNTDVTVSQVVTSNSGWTANSNMGVFIQLNNITKSNGFGAFCNAELVNDNIHMYDKYGDETPLLYKVEGQGNGFLINRTKGANYNNQIVKIPANLKVKMGNPYASTNDYLDETITVTEEAIYICKLADGEYGAWEKLVNPTSITLDKEDLTLKVNGTSKLTAKVEGTTNGTLFYKSSNTNVATVDEEGNIVAKGKGEATITANCGTIKKSIKVSVTSDEPSVQTGIKIIKGKTIEIYKGENYSLSDLKVVKVYNDNPEGEEVTLTSDMISGTFDNNKAGTYTLTITSGEFSDTFTITVKDAGVIGVKELKKGYNFGNNSGWGDFYLQTDAPNVGTQWLNIKGEAFNNLNKYIKVNGKSGVLSNVKCFHGVRYEFWFDTETKNSLKAGDVITISKDTPFYYYSGTTDGNHEPMGDGTYQARNRLDKEYKFVYTGHDYEVFAGEPTELNVANSSVTLAVGEEIQINYSVGPTGTYGTPTFSGYDDKIISVSKYGKIIGLATGNTQVTLTLGSLTKIINVTVLNAKDIKEFEFTNIPTYFSILKDTKNVDLTSKLKTGKYIFSDNTESGEVQVTSVKMKTNLDTSVIGTKQVEFDVTINSKTYTATVEVQIYEYYDQKPSEVAIVEWFDYAVFLQFPKTMTNAVNITGANDEENALLKETMKNISYTRKDGTEVKLNGGYELATNIAIFPEFMYEQKDEKGNVIHAKIGADNYNSDGYYMAGDMITVLQDTPIYKWTGSKGDQDRPVAGTGEYIIEGYIKEKLVYKFNGSVWTSFIEYTDMVVNTKTLEVTVGKTGTIEAKRIPDNATQGVFSYESSDSSIATVNSYGIVKGLKEGKVTITITLKDEDDPSKTKTGTCEVTVVDGITSINFDKDSYDVSLGTSVEDLLKKFSGSYVYASGKVGEKVDFTNATIDGYNKDKEGSQNITVTVNKDGKSITSAIKVNVTSKKGCGGDIITTSALISTLALLGVGVMLTITYKKKKENK